MKRRNLPWCITIILLIACFPLSAQLYEVSKGTVHFTSDAPLENIQAESPNLKGLLNLVDNTFAFTIDIKSFSGFNSDLQREHFHENYMESAKFPKATYTGKLIDKFNPDLATQTIRTKGKLEIHGVSHERIIEIIITKKNSTYSFTTLFNVAIADHGITIPRIVYQKIAEIISVKVDGEMAKK